MDLQFVYRVHKWLAVAVAAVTIGWFASGVLMVVPDRWLTLSPGIRPSEAETRLVDAPSFDRATVTPSQAIDALRHHMGRAVRVTGMRLRRLPGHLAYEISTEQVARVFVDAVTGEVFAITEQISARIVASVRGTAASVGPITVQHEPTLGYGGPFPAYRVPVADGKGTVFYVDAGTGQVRLTDSLSRVAAFVMGLHVLAFLRGILPATAVKALMILLAIAGVLMSVAGVVILIAQLRRWWQRTRVVRKYAAR